MTLVPLDAADAGDQVAPVDSGLPLPDAQVRWAIDVVERIGALEALAVFAEAERKSPAGRPESFPLKATIVAWLLAAVTRQAMFLSTVRDIMFCQLSPAMRTELGIPDPPAADDARGWAACYRNVETRWTKLVDLLDPSPLPKNRRLNAEDYEAAIAKAKARRSDEERSIRYERLEWFINQIIEASLPPEVLGSWCGTVAVDATFVPAFSRGQRHTKGEDGYTADLRRSSSDPDAGYFHP